MADLSVRYLLKSYILISVCLIALILGEVQGVTTARLGKTPLSKLTFVSPKYFTSGSMSSLLLTVLDFPFNIAWECGVQFEVNTRHIGIPFSHS